jgi:hypothetical protein
MVGGFILGAVLVTLAYVRLGPCRLVGHRRREIVGLAGVRVECGRCGQKGIR